jgi:hypothetical protein
MKGILDVPNETLNEKYLGMPSDVGRSVNGAFKFLRDRLWKRVQGWIETILSAGGKEILIKSVAQAIPIFSMACFKLPRGLCQKLNALIRDFWWGSRKGQRRTCWVSWEEMTTPKFAGGLGFRDIELFNLALLAQRAWRLLQNPETLNAQILKAVYYPNTDLLNASLGAHPLQVWRSILEGRDIMLQGLVRRIGTGEQTRAWDENWLPRDEVRRPITCLESNAPQLVSDFIDQTSASWDLQKLQRFFLPMDVEVITMIPLSTRRIDDCWAWHFEKTGIFSVRSAYKMIINIKLREKPG